MLSNKLAKSVKSLLTFPDNIMDAYKQGLNGRQAARAARKYRRHRVSYDFALDGLEIALQGNLSVQIWRAKSQISHVR